MSEIKLTRAQADTLNALRSAQGQFIDTTVEISGYDNSGRGTGRRLLALQAKGLCERGHFWNQRCGFRWMLTELGNEIAYKVHLRDCKLRAEFRRAGGNAFGMAFDLSGTYRA